MFGLQSAMGVHVVNFGEVLRVLRGNMSLREASRLTGISHTYLDRLEKGVDPRTGKQIEPSGSVLNALANAYNVPAELMLILVGYIDIIKTSRDPEMVEIMDNLYPTTDKEQILRLIEMWRIQTNDRKFDSDRERTLAETDFITRNLSRQDTDQGNQDDSAGQTTYIPKDKIPMPQNAERSMLGFHPSLNVQRNQQIVRDAPDKYTEGYREKAIMIPVLGVIRAGYDLYAEQQVIDVKWVPEGDVADGEYFYLLVTGDSMSGANILEGMRVLVRRQDWVDDGKIGVVLINGDEATLKYVFHEDSYFILQAANATYAPRKVPVEETRILGQVKEVVWSV